MVTYQQAAVIIPSQDLQQFFNRYGLQLKTTDPKQVGAYMQQVVETKGKPALDDLQNLCKTSLKKMMHAGGGCGCDDKKTLGVDGNQTIAVPDAVVIVKQDNSVISFAKKNPIAAVAIVLGVIWVLKKL